MTAIATNKFRIRNAQNFLASVTNVTDNTPLYAFIGRPQSWAVDAPAGETVSETVPRTPHDHRENESYTMQSIMQMKRVNAESVTHACRNRKWNSGYFYSPYRSDYDGTIEVKSLTNGSAVFKPETLAEANYYVVSGGFVYICLEEGTGASTIDPYLGVGTSYSPTRTGDGYLWKMIVQASATELAMFETPDFFPISNNTTNKTYQAAAQTHVQPGAIYSIRVPVGGTGTGWGTADITDASNVAGTGTSFVRVIGDGVGLKFNLKVANDKITGVEVVDPGTGYTFVKFVAGPGASGKTLGELKGIITPKKGLGADVVTDLNGYFTIVSNLLTGAEGGTYQGVTVNNDYRTVGLISKPLNWNTTTQCTGSVIDATTIIVLEDGVNIGPDDVVTLGGNRQAYVVDTGTVPTDAFPANANAGKQYLRVIYTQIENDSYGEWISTDQPQVGDTVVLNSISTTIAAIQNPGYEPQSGELLYYENRRQISRASDQNEYIRVVIEF